MSLVDGYTLPFKLEVSGGSCTRVQKPFTGTDCSGLYLSQCPSHETLDGETRSLHAVDPKNGQVAGCYSPCMRLIDTKWQSSSLSPDSAAAGPYCCAGAWGSPATCQAGPILQTKFVEQVH